MDDTDLPALLLSRKMERLKRVHQHLPAFASIRPLLHSTQTSQWSLRMRQDTFNKAHGWVEPRLHHSGFLLAVLQPDNRMVRVGRSFSSNNRQVSHQIRDEYGRVWNTFYDLKQSCLGFILIGIRSAWCIQDADPCSQAKMEDSERRNSFCHKI